MPTRIEWCDETINPLGQWCFGSEGTKDNPKPCDYCYARVLAKRRMAGCEKCHSFNVPHTHLERMAIVEKWKKPRNVFIQSMGDLFHSEVPDEWIKAVLEAANKAPQHTYFYLTKNPDRYYQLGEGDDDIIPSGGASGYFGASACTEEQAQAAYENLNCTWMSLEPLQGEFSEEFFSHENRYTQTTETRWLWIVVGAETGNRKNKIIPKRKWIENIVKKCREQNTPVFMKDSLKKIWGEPLIREFPWEGVKNGC